MRHNLFDHIDLRVSDVARARQLYDVFFPAVGFTRTHGSPESTDDEGEGQPDDGRWASYGMESPGDPKPPFIWLNEEPGHRGGANRIAFWADTEAEVNRIAALIAAAGARVVEGPEYCYDYSPGYYAVFFEDEDGNKWEVCCRTAPVRSRPA